MLFQPWAEALYKERAVQNSKGTPSEKCLPHGITKAVSVPEPFKIVQTSDLILVLHEEFNHYRQIFMDGRSVAANRTPRGSGIRLLDGTAIPWLSIRRASWTRPGSIFVVILPPTRSIS